MSLPRPSTATREWRLRTSLILLLVTATVATFGLIGSGVLLARVPVALKEDRQLMRSLAVNLAQHFEQWIDGLEGRLGALAGLTPDFSPAQVQGLLDAAVAEGGFQVIYLVSSEGRVLYAALAEVSHSRRANLSGADLSRNRLFDSAHQSGRRVWSDRYLSTLDGGTAIGLAIPHGEFVLLAEVAPDFAREAIHTGAQSRRYPVMVVDRVGEYVAGRNVPESDRLRNWAADLPADSRTAEGAQALEMIIADQIK